MTTPTGTGIANTAKAFSNNGLVIGFLVLGAVLTITVYKDWGAPSVETAGLTREEATKIAEAAAIAERTKTFGPDFDREYVDNTFKEIYSKLPEGDDDDGDETVGDDTAPPTSGPEEKKDLADATPPPAPTPTPTTPNPSAVVPPTDSEPMFPGADNPLHDDVNPVFAARLITLRERCGAEELWPRIVYDPDSPDSVSDDQFEKTLDEECPNGYSPARDLSIEDVALSDEEIAELDEIIASALGN